MFLKTYCNWVAMFVPSGAMRTAGDKVCKKQPKLLFSYINKQKKCRESIRSLVHEGTNITNGVDIANCMNQTFYRSFTRDDNISLPIFQEHNIEMQKVGTYIFDLNLIKKHLLKLNRYKSPGPDGIHPYV